MDIEKYLDEVLSYLKESGKDFDEFNLRTDIKQHIFSQAEKLSLTKNIPASEAVDIIIDDLGSSQNFSLQILKEIEMEKKYLRLKLLLAAFLAIGPIVLIILGMIFL